MGLKKYKNGFKPTFHENTLRDPIKGRKAKRIFVCSMADLFGEWVPKEWINKVIEICKETPRHKYYFLTKNPKRYSEFDFPENCWLGFSASTYREFSERSWCMEGIKKWFVSFEPLRENIPLAGLLRPEWVIVGVETGNKLAVYPEKVDIEHLITYARSNSFPIFIKDNVDWPEKIQEIPKW